MPWSGRNVTISVGGKPINFAKSIEVSHKAIPEISTRMLSFSSGVIREIDCKATFNGRLKYANGDEFYLKSMQVSNAETPYDYSFNFSSISIGKVMKTKGRQPRFIKVWREL